MSDEIMEALRRIEAKVDALTEWSGWFDANGNPLTRAELAEVHRKDADIQRVGLGRPVPVPEASIR